MYQGKGGNRVRVRVRGGLGLGLGLRVSVSISPTSMNTAKETFVVPALSRPLIVSDTPGYTISRGVPLIVPVSLSIVNPRGSIPALIVNQTFSSGNVILVTGGGLEIFAPITKEPVGTQNGPEHDASDSSLRFDKDAD